MSNVDLFVYGVLLKDGHFTCIFAVVQYPMRIFITILHTSLFSKIFATCKMINTFIVKTQRNSTQLNSTKATQKQLRWVRLSSHLEPTAPTPLHTFQVLLDQLKS